MAEVDLAFRSLFAAFGNQRYLEARDVESDWSGRTYRIDTRNGFIYIGYDENEKARFSDPYIVNGGRQSWRGGSSSSYESANRGPYPRWVPRQAPFAVFTEHSPNNGGGRRSTPEPSLILGCITLGGLMLGSKRKTKG